MSGGTILTSHDAGMAAIYVDEQGTGNATINQTGGSVGLVGTPIVGTGLYANTSSTGNVDVTAATVYSTGTSIYANAGGSGTVHVVTNATVNSTSGVAVLSQANHGATTIVNNGALSGNSNSGVVYATSSGGTISITNAVGGTIASNQASPETQMAIITSGGATNFTNDGTLSGRLSLANATNTFVNTGTWTTDGANPFGGTTTLTNTGTITIGTAGEINGSHVSIINDAGTLRDNGMIDGDVTVNGGTLAGNGLVIGTVAVNSGGTLAPGNSIGTFRVNGDVTFSAGSTYAIEVSPSAADKTTVTGTASLTGGTVQATWQPGFYFSRSFTILSSAGLGGTTFAGLTNVGLPSTVTASLSYTSTDALLNVVVSGNTVTGLTINQQNVADTVSSYFNNGGASQPGFNALFGLSGSALRNALDQLSGEVATGAPTAGFQSMGQFLGAMANPFGASPGGSTAGFGSARGFAAERPVTPEAASAYAAVTPRDAQQDFGKRWGLWAEAYGGSGRADGDGAVLGSHDVNARSYGVIAGADYRATADTTLGFALGAGGTNWGLAGDLGSGRGDVFQVGGYGIQRIGAAYVSGAFGYAWHNMSTDRTVTVSGADTLNASFQAHSVGARLEGGYRFAMPVANVTPYAALQAQAFHTPSYSESAASGSNQFALTYDAKTTSTNRVEVGAWFDRSYLLADDQAVLLRARVAWAHDGNTDRAATAAFQTLAATNFVASGAAGPRNVGLFSTGAEFNLSAGWTVAGTFDGEFSGTSAVYGGRTAIRHIW